GRRDFLHVGRTHGIALEEGIGHDPLSSRRRNDERRMSIPRDGELFQSGHSIILVLSAHRGRCRGRAIIEGMQPIPLTLIRGSRKRADERPRVPKPEWLKVRAPGSENYHRLKGLMRTLGLHTVCEEANCPNIGECWHHGTATFMILGDTCTRSCGYCNVIHGTPAAPDAHEPANVASAIQAMALAHVVITSVDRDDLPDYGAGHFARTITETRARIPQCGIEVLIPDFKGDEASLRLVLDARPDILNHNIETVPRMYR